MHARTHARTHTHTHTHARTHQVFAEKGQPLRRHLEPRCPQRRHVAVGRRGRQAPQPKTWPRTRRRRRPRSLPGAAWRRRFRPRWRTRWHSRRWPPQQLQRPMQYVGGSGRPCVSVCSMVLTASVQAAAATAPMQHMAAGWDRRRASGGRPPPPSHRGGRGRDRGRGREGHYGPPPPHHHPHQQQQQQQQQRPRPPVFQAGGHACAPCQRDFATHALLEAHVAEHASCTQCPYRASAKLVRQHEDEAHGATISRLVPPLESPEDIARWREERKRRWPTVARVEVCRLVCTWAAHWGRGPAAHASCVGAGQREGTDA
jgi:hypothetical protein